MSLTFTFSLTDVFVFSPRQASRANLNHFPVYLGQPPGYVSSRRSASGYLWGASTYADALTVEQVRRSPGFSIYCCIIPVFCWCGLFMACTCGQVCVEMLLALLYEYGCVVCCMYVKDDYLDAYPV